MPSFALLTTRETNADRIRRVRVCVQVNHVALQSDFFSGDTKICRITPGLIKRLKVRRSAGKTAHDVRLSRIKICISWIKRHLSRWDVNLVTVPIPVIDTVIWRRNTRKSMRDKLKIKLRTSAYRTVFRTQTGHHHGHVYEHAGQYESNSNDDKTHTQIREVSSHCCVI